MCHTPIRAVAEALPEAGRYGHAVTGRAVGPVVRHITYDERARGRLRRSADYSSKSAAMVMAGS
ncbi:hypothetical protein LTT66_16965 [Nocardia gipuzkoensis]|uniref:hypothetical protein n=1 Tax=Nocardia gipuzkoensis TaxID=2749991 RepID=UPI001E4F603C|nr:hypothetical protein [Nocardia gipuzkoensis]UGT71687.1 hypothetical protein LTT66_16965 [Nocardia gipuzkoensis]